MSAGSGSSAVEPSLPAENAENAHCPGVPLDVAHDGAAQRSRCLPIKPRPPLQVHVGSLHRPPGDRAPIARDLPRDGCASPLNPLVGRSARNERSLVGRRRRGGTDIALRRSSVLEAHMTQSFESAINQFGPVRRIQAAYAKARGWPLENRPKVGQHISSGHRPVSSLPHLCRRSYVAAVLLIRGGSSVHLLASPNLRYPMSVDSDIGSINAAGRKTFQPGNRNFLPDIGRLE